MSCRPILLNQKYIPLLRPFPDVRYYIVTGGRGSGKSFAGSLAYAHELTTAHYKMLYLRQTLVSARISIIPEFYEKLELISQTGEFVQGMTEICNTKTGCKLYFRGIQTSRKSNEAQLKSIKGVGRVLIDEAQEFVDEAAFDRVDFSLRDKGSPNTITMSLNPTVKSHWIYQRFFKAPGVADDFNGVSGDTCYIHTTYLDNLRNLDASFIAGAERMKAQNYGKYQNLFLGFWIGENEGALWTDAMISPHRVATFPADMEKIVVAIDPAVTSDEKSDETGIVVAGSKRMHGERHYFVLSDRSMQGTPGAWIGAAVTAYHEFSADRIVAEVNNGGDLVEALLKQQPGRIPYKAVRASRGKLTRAEPVSALYEKGIVHHVGTFGRLEEQMRTYTGATGEKSPDRMDALVWALSELMSGGKSGVIE